MIVSQPLYETIKDAAAYADAYNALMQQPTNRLRIQAVARTLAAIPTPVTRVVDVASGGGAYTNDARAVLGHSSRFVAVDRQFACVGGYRFNHPAATGAVADVTALPFRESMFDLALCLDIIEHLPDDIGFMRGIGRLLRPGGWALVCTHNSRSLEHLAGLTASAVRRTKWVGWDPTHLRFYNRSSLTGVLRQAGFETVAFEGTYFLPFHLPARLVSWPLERAGLKGLARAVHRVVQAPGYAINAALENWSASPFRTLGWGLIALARKTL